MKITKGTKLKVKSDRKGTYFAIAIKDFDTKDEWYPVAVAEGVVEGMSNFWEEGEEIPCRGSLCSIEVLE